jgi:HEAT repeat protein
MDHAITIFLIFISLCSVVSGCGETNDDRRQISKHIDDLAAKVKSNPSSKESQIAFDELVKIVNGNWSFARSRACWALGELGSRGARAVPDLMRAAESADPYVEEAAVRALGSVGPSSAPAVELLMKKVEIGASGRSTRGVILYAARALGDIGKPATKAIPVLERARQSNDEFLAEESQKALDKLTKLVEKPKKVEISGESE